MDGAETRLAVYGTLAPGEPNHHQLSALEGIWRDGQVTGWLVAEGWGAALGYPALVPDPAGGTIAVKLFESAELPQHWHRLDAFEGEGYRRVPIVVETDSGAVEASIYVAAEAR